MKTRQEKAGSLPRALPSPRARSSGGGSRSLAPPTASGLLTLQQTAGNQAVQRLMSAGDFRKSTKLNLANRGKTLSEMDRLLGEYHALGAKRATSEGRDKTRQLLHEIAETADFWLDSHENDRTRSHQREPGIRRLRDQAAGELVRSLAQAPSRGPVFTAEKNKFVSKMEGSASSILSYLGTAIGLAIPKPGDSVEASMEVSIPCDSYGVSYVGFRIAASASRMNNKATKVRFEAAITGGAQIAGLADIGGELGLFIESQGATPEQAMKLVSYAWYRQFRESPMIPREVANFMWGGSASSVGHKRAERWAANVEKEAFTRKPGDTDLSSGVGSSATTNQFVRLGFMAGVGADVGGVAGSIVDLAGSASISGGKHYDQTSIEKAKGVGNVGRPMKEKGRFRTKDLSTGFITADTSIGATIGMFSGSIGMALEIMFRKQATNSWPEGYISVNGSLSATIPGNTLLLKLVADGLKSATGQLLKAMKGVETKAKQDKSFKDAGSFDVAGAGLSTALSTVPAAAGLGMDLIPQPITLTMSIAGGWQFGKIGQGWTFEISVSRSSGFDVQAGVAGASFTKSSRLLRIVLAADGDWKVPNLPGAVTID